MAYSARLDYVSHKNKNLQFNLFVEVKHSTLQFANKGGLSGQSKARVISAILILYFERICHLAS